ncbi:probable E3 ubiquitin-protein ligase HERC2 isoform X2 [Sesamum indicum]|uniref:Probable E3 ubiquitin-protein ligase HERC2 isoform X2 n=1 Tax=Sesamum indicum TaxID=4182 RepID=A0A8M8V6T7_SESIN|nr:probable E3 ubiquitin-protein ligase HERC2 isoform X2 [Sesamum indicum]
MALLLRRTLTPISCPCWWRHLSATAAPKPPPLLWEHSSKTSTSKESIILQLFSWGRGASGQLGGGIEEIRIYPAPVATLSVPLNFSLSHAIPGRLSQRLSSSEAQVEVGISCGLFHSGLVVDGKLWIWGKGDGGRLGFGHENPVFVPTLNPNLESKLKSIALGGLHSVALDVLGRVFTWGYGGFGALGHSVYHRELLPKLVEGSWDGEICCIATSGTHTAAITKSGKLYIWGRDEGDGRLGLGPGCGPDHAGGNSTPSEVKALPVPVAAASCGGFFTMALSEEGQLWNWGDKGEVLSWGHGGHGQLGHSSLHSRKIPEPVEALANERISYIACGGSSSAAITDKGKLYMWGNTADSQLGVPGLRDVQSSPIEVKFLLEDDGLGDHNVVSVAVGASHAMCLVSRSGG